MLTTYVALAAIVPSEGINKNGRFLERLSTPAASDCNVNLTGKDEMLEISKDFSAVSPTKTLENDKIPSSGEMLTSGLTPVPFKFTDTIVVPE